MRQLAPAFSEKWKKRGPHWAFSLTLHSKKAQAINGCHSICLMVILST
jgi:hypothetical protein